MMEEIDLFDQETPTNSCGEQKQTKAASTSLDKTNNTTVPPNAAAASARNGGDNYSGGPLRLPRTSGIGRTAFLKDTLQAQIPTSDQLKKRKEQAGKVFKKFGNQLGKINLGKLIDKMEQDQGLADALESLNVQMKEEVERQEVRREAEALTIKVITDHLDEFLANNLSGTYEEWIQDLHPENANQGLLFQDIQQIDERFYVMESDHRRLWNEAVEKQENENHEGEAIDKTKYAHRLVEARTQIWGRAPGANVQSHNGKSTYSDSPSDDSLARTNENPMIDLLSGSNDFQSNETKDPAVNDNGIEQVDFFAPAVSPVAGTVPSNDTTRTETSHSNVTKDPFEDLMNF